MRDRAEAVDADAMYDLFVSELGSSLVLEEGKLEALIERSKKKGRKGGLSSVLPQKRKKAKLTVFDTDPEASEEKQGHEEPFSFSFF